MLTASNTGPACLLTCPGATTFPPDGFTAGRRKAASPPGLTPRLPSTPPPDGKRSMAPVSGEVLRRLLLGSGAYPSCFAFFMAPGGGLDGPGREAVMAPARAHCRVLPVGLPVSLAGWEGAVSVETRENPAFANPVRCFEPGVAVRPIGTFSRYARCKKVATWGRLCAPPVHPSTCCCPPAARFFRGHRPLTRKQIVRRLLYGAQLTVGRAAAPDSQEQLPAPPLRRPGCGPRGWRRAARARKGATRIRRAPR